MNFKKAFTLLELFIGFSILILIGSISTMWIYQKTQKERFFSQVDRLQKSISLCKKMARIRGENFCLSIFQNNNEIQYEVEKQSGFLPAKKNLVQKSYFSFKENKARKIVLEFQPNGTYYPHGVLKIYSNKKKFTKTVSL